MGSLQKVSVVDGSVMDESSRGRTGRPCFKFNDTVETIFDWIGFLSRRFLTERSEDSLAQSLVTLPAAMRLMNAMYREKPSLSFLQMLFTVLSRDGDIPFNKLFSRLKVIDGNLARYYILPEQREANDIFLSWCPQLERE